jgi:hypothetical protein
MTAAEHAGRAHLKITPITLTLAAIFLAGLLVRSAMAFFGRGGPDPYELFCFLEQGHRLAFGSGVVPFEFVYGYRSWLIPGFIAGVMKVCDWFSSDPSTYLDVLRCIAIALSLSVIAAGYLFARRTVGAAWALVSALFCALWYQTVFYAPSLDPGVLAAYQLLFAIYLAEEEAPPTALRGTAIGMLLGLTFYFRFHLTPAIVVVAFWYLRNNIEEKLLPLLSGIAAALVPLGLLDYLTWGSPFQSIWLNFYMNSVQDIAGKYFGTFSIWYYFHHLIASPRWWFVSISFGALAILGARRSPLLALCIALVVVSHSLIPHKEERFIAFATISIPILMGLGVPTAYEWLTLHGRQTLAVSLSLTMIVAVVGGSAIGLRSTLLAGYNAGMLHAMLAAHEDKHLCGLAIADSDWFFTGGYTYLDRNVPIYFPAELTFTTKRGFYAEKDLPGLRLATEFILDNKPLIQFSQDHMLRRTNAYNEAIIAAGKSIPGYRKATCFPDPASQTPEFCLLRRSGGCT